MKLLRGGYYNVRMHNFFILIHRIPKFITHFHLYVLHTETLMGQNDGEMSFN